MTSPHPRRRFKRSLVIGLASAVTAAAIALPPASAMAQESEASNCARDESVLQERSESSALGLAVECDAQVLIGDSQSYSSRSFAQADGTIATEFTAAPRWVPDDAGDWIEADPTIETAEDGSLQTKATVSDLQFGSEGDTVFVTAANAEGESVSLEWTAPLPEPVLDGDTVTYPEVLPDVDLEVYAGVASFSYALVVKTPEAAADDSLARVEFGLATEGLSVDADAATDTAALTDADGEAAFQVDRPLMWDSPEAGDDAAMAPMEMDIDTDALAVVPDQEFLTDPETEYPVYIDPEFTDTTASSEEVFSQATGISCGTSTELCVGAQIWQADNALGYWRSAIRFHGLDALRNRDVQKTSVWIKQLHTGDAGGPNQTVRLYAMNHFDFSGSVSWDTFTGKIVSLVATDSVPTSNEGANEADQLITWEDTRTANRVQQVVDSGATTTTFAMVSGADTNQEGNRDYFRKLDVESASMTVWHAPLKPTNLQTFDTSLTNPVGQCSTSAPGPVINTTTPTFKAKAPASLTSNNTINFYVYDSTSGGENYLRKMSVNAVSEGETVPVTVTSGTLERGKTYRWRARVWDADANSSRDGEYSAYCYFTVNSLPSMPTGLKAEAASNQCGTQSNPTVVTTPTPKLSAIPADPDGGKVTARFAVYPASGAFLDEWDVTGVTSGSIATTRVPVGLLQDGLYRWNAATRDAFGSSAWPPFCWIKIDTTAPAPPDVVQVTTNPLPGGIVEFDVIGDSDVRSFEYSLDNGAKQTVSGTTGQAGFSVTLPSTGSIDHILQVWARDFAVGSSGNTSSVTTHLFTAITAQPAEASGAWRFDGDSLDDAGAHDLTAIGALTTGTDKAGREDAAAVFNGTSSTCLKADAPIVDTVKSYTMAGWVYVDAAGAADTAVMDVTGGSTSNLKLLLSAGGQWGVTMTKADGSAESTAVKAPATATVYGTWTHVAAVYDAAAVRLRLYVNGTLMGSKMAPEAWAATGTFSVGCGVKATGATFGNLTGSVDDAVIFQQPLTDEQIDELMTGAGIPAALQAWYPLRYDDAPGAVPGADYSGRGADLTAMPATPTWLPDQHGRKDSALDFNGAVCPTAGEVPVRTDSSFSVSAWARLDADHVTNQPRVFSFNGAHNFAVMAKYNGISDKWNMSITSDDAVTPAWGDAAISPEIATEEAWNQITVTVDADSKVLQLFVNGELAGSRAVRSSWESWRASEFVIGCDGSTDGSRSWQWDGAISDVRVWRGVLDADEIRSSHTEALGWWELGKTPEGQDAWAGNHLTMNGDYSWEVDRYNACWAAYGLALGGSGWAETAGPVVTTDESFTVAAWARIDNLDAFRTIVAQSGTTNSAFKLAYNPVFGRFQFSMAQNDTGDRWTRAVADEAPVIDEATGLGQWYHLTGQVDLGAGVIRLYVNGVLQSEAPVVNSPWRATGGLTIGAIEQGGVVSNQMVGAIDEVFAYGGVLDENMIKTLAADNPGYDPTGAPDCGGDTEEPPPIDP